MEGFTPIGIIHKSYLADVFAAVVLQLLLPLSSAPGVDEFATKFSSLLHVGRCDVR